MNRTVVIWFCWVVAVVFFSWSIYWAPTSLSGEGKFLGTAPEFFLSMLGVWHLVAGAVLLASSLKDEVDWLD